MNGVRVQGINPQCPKKIVWQYFIELCGDASTISDVYYPVLNNDAIIIFRDVSVATKILTSRHDKWNVLPLPNQVFSKQRVWLEKDLSDLLRDQDIHIDTLKTQAHVDVSLDSTTQQIMLTGHTYQIEWAWRYLSNLQDQQEDMSGTFHAAATTGAATPSMTNGHVLTNGDVVPTFMRDRPHAGHSSLTLSPRTHHPSRFQNGDGVSTSDARSLAAEGLSSGGRRLPSPGGREVSRAMGVDPSGVTSLAIEGLDRPGSSQGATGAARSSGATRRSTLNAGSAKPKVPPIAASNREDDHDDSRPSLAAAVVEDSEQRDHLTSLNSRADRHFNGEQGVSAYSSLPASKSGGARSSPESANAEAPTNYGRTPQGWSPQTDPSSSVASVQADVVVRASRQNYLASCDVSPAPYDDDADYGAVGGAGHQSLRPECSEDVDYDPMGSRGMYGGQRAFSSLPYNSSSSLRLPSNNKLALLNRSVVELSRKHFQVGHRLKLKIYVDDITRTKVDAVVNAANWELKNVGGVAGALAKAAGVEMEQECERIYRERGALRTAQVVRTKAYGKLSHLKYVFHTVGPIFRLEDPDKCVFELAQTFLNCLQYAEKLNLDSVTFPFISTGIFGMPIELCVVALFTGLNKYSYERNSGLATLEEVHFINNDMDSVCNAVLCAEATSKKENMDSAVQRMLEGERLYGRGVFPFCDEKDHPSNKASPTTRSSIRSSSEDRYGTWDSTGTSGGATAAAAAAEDDDNDQDDVSSSSRSRHRSGQRTSMQDQHAAGPQSMSAIDRRSRPRSGSSDHRSRTSMTGAGSDGKSSGTTKVRESSPMPRLRSRSNSTSGADRGSGGASSTQGGSTAFGSSSTASRTPPVIKQSLVPNTATSGKKRSMSLVKSMGKGRTADPNSGNDTDQSSTAASETEDPPDRMCAICLDDPMKQPKRLPCGHQFCAPCVDRAMKVQPRCPKCQRLFGIPPGTQPRMGTMTYNIDYTSNLSGCAAYGTVTITYDFRPGIQEACHPNPGRPYEGTHRVAYLPACPEGREVLKLLQKAFEHRLVFTIGNSVTTGRQGVITWNDIHHKTSTYGGPSQFGYPDPDYLRRVKEELASKGIIQP